MTIAVLAEAGFAAPIRRALRNDFLRHSALVFGASMACNVFNYAFNFAISRRIGVENYAALSSLINGLIIVSIPAAVANLVIVKYTAEFHAVADDARLWRLSQLLLKWTAVAAVILFAAGMMLRSAVASFLHIPNDATITLCVAIMALGFLMPSVRGILQGEQDFRRYSVSVTLEVLFKVLLGVGLVYAGYGVFGAMAGWLCGTTLALAYTIWAVRVHRAQPGELVRLSLDLRRLVQTCLGVAVATAAMTLLSFMDVVLVKHYFNAHEAGLYAAVNLTGKVILFLVSFLPMILLPKAVAQAKRSESTTGLLAQATLGTVVMAGTVLAIFGIEPARALSLLAGHAFSAGAAYVFQYDLAIGLLACLSVVVNYKIGLHRFDFLVPLCIVLCAEAAAIVFYHRSLWEVIHILLIGNAAAVMGCSFKLRFVSTIRANSEEAVAA